MDRVTARHDGSLAYHHDDSLMHAIYDQVWSTRDPEFSQVQVPMLAIVPDGDFHPDVPANVTDELRRAADQFWRAKLRPWIRERTAQFRSAAPAARIMALDSPYHHIFIAEEAATAAAICEFLESRACAPG
jgi:hypothetical protein